jgi:hypothetical protein
MKKIHNTIAYEETTKVVSGNLNDYIELNKLFIGTTKNVFGSCKAIEQYLTNTGIDRMKKWGKSRLDYIFKNVFKIKVSNYELMIVV